VLNLTSSVRARWTATDIQTSGCRHGLCLLNNEIVRPDTLSGSRCVGRGPAEAPEGTGLLLEADVPIETVSVSDSEVEPFNRAGSSALEAPPPPSAESFHRDLVLSMRNGVLAIHRDGSVAVVNECAYRTLGLIADSRHLGQHYTALLGADHQFAQVFGTAFELTHLPNRCEVRLGETGKVLGYTLSRIVDEENRVTGAVLYFKNLTRVEQLEERERLRDRLAALGEMAAAIAHEVKNPLAGIQVMAGLLKRQSSMSDDD